METIQIILYFPGCTVDESLPASEGTQVQSLVQEDPMHRNYSACALEPRSHSKRSHYNEKLVHCNWRIARAHHN